MANHFPIQKSIKAQNKDLDLGNAIFTLQDKEGVKSKELSGQKVKRRPHELTKDTRTNFVDHYIPWKQYPCWLDALLSIRLAGLIPNRDVSS